MMKIDRTKAAGYTENVKMQIGQNVDENKYAGEWLHQRTGSFADSPQLAVRTLKTGRQKASFGVRGQSRRGAPVNSRTRRSSAIVRFLTEQGDNQGGTAIIIVPESNSGAFFVFDFSGNFWGNNEISGQSAALNDETGAVHDESK
ncbi:MULTISPECIES: hypothetical protein [Paenibacillus]|uniref:hypothetical protein n=2 Tax=Paenibacillus TaxID=44249 RepID=UPI0004F6712D|nr:hypothetical protein [Paenibacillus sp. FSL P4-0081]AIQ28419.1 hypothetical protein P40081_09700 [Paenibacillus sp. FSL P4-0081]OMF33230.1 hypothetical protein BK132_03185 [Paenibacillus sp. FSL H8-0259]